MRKGLWKRTFASLIALTMIVGLSACGSADTSGSSGSGSSGSSASDSNQDKTLNVIAWSSMFTDKQKAAIKEATGITVNVTPFDSLEELFTKMSNSQDYDMAVSGDYMVNTLAQYGLIKALDWSKLEGVKDNLPTNFVKQNYDPDLKYSCPLSGGTVGFLINTDKITKDIKTWQDLFDESLKGQIVMLDDQRIILGVGNVLCGNDFNDDNADDVNKAEQKMAAVKANVKTFTSFGQYEAFLNGEANIMVGWSYEAYIAAQQLLAKGNTSWKYVYPEEGMHVYVDNYTISSKTTKDDLVYQLIKYCESDAFNQICWDEAPGSRVASKSFAASLKMDDTLKTIVYPPDEQYTKGLYLKNLGDKLTIYSDAWTTFMNE